MKRRLLAWFLVCTMVLSLIPMDVRAEEDGDSEVENTWHVQAVGDADVRVPYGDTATLEVEAIDAEGVDLTYQWYMHDEEGVAVELEGTTTCTTGEITASTYYWCEVTDATGGFDSVWFTVSVDSGLTVDAVGDTDITVTAGETVELKVEASVDDNTDITYQWYVQDYDEGRQDISDATGATYTITNIRADGQYGCEVTDIYGNTESVDFYIEIDAGWTAIPEEGEDITVDAGQSATLKVVVESEVENTFTYQWYDEYDEEIEGETSATFITPRIEEYTEYYCIVTDEDGNEEYVWFYIELNTGWTAEAEETSVGVDAGQSATLKVVVESEVENTFTYQWYDEDYEPIEGATSETFVTPKLNGYTEYWCEVTDEDDNIEEIWFEVYINTEWTAVAANKQYEHNVGVDGTATLEVAIDKGDDHTFTYEWYKYGEEDDEWIEDEESASYTTEVIEERTVYYCVVTDEYGNSQEVYFSVYVGPSWSASAKGGWGMPVELNSAATLEVEVVSEEDVSLEYQWYQVGEGYEYTLIEGATQSSYTTDAITSRTVYCCEVSDKYGKVESVVFSVAVNAYWNAEAVGETELSVARHDITTLKVMVNNEKAIPLTYQWWKADDTEEGMEPIKNATGMSYTTEGLAADTVYYCLISDVYANKIFVKFNLTIDEEKQHTHVYGEYEVEDNATCGKAGTEVGVCAGCKEDDTKTIPATGKHAYGEWKVTKEATCTVAGTKARTCAVCKKEETEAIPATGKHTYGEWKVTKEATCTAKGSQERVCSVCNGKETSEIVAIGYVKGATFTKSNYTYKITAKSGKKGSVTCVATTKKLKTVSVPKTVKVGGITFKVTAIADKAFKGNTKLTSVTIGANVTKIGKEAFSGCKKLKKITIKSTVLKSVGNNAIKGIDKNTTIKVPKSKLSKYKNLFKTKTGYKKTMKIKK